MFAFPVLLGDIGGTNARFAVLPAPGEPVCLLPRALTAQTPGPVEAIRTAARQRARQRRRSSSTGLARTCEPAMRLVRACGLRCDDAPINSPVSRRRHGLRATAHGCRRRTARSSPEFPRMRAWTLIAVNAIPPGGHERLRFV